MRLSRTIMGYSVPKQFCRVFGEATLLQQTVRRVSLSVRLRQTLIVVTRPHEKFYAPTLNGISTRNLIVQPENRGTSSAILYALFRLAKEGRDVDVAIFPSDHYAENDRSFMAHVDLAFRAVSERPELIVLLGIKPGYAETGYGWIEPAEPIGFSAPLFRVERFWEKPGPALARTLWSEGCLWNSFVLVGRLSTFLELMAKTLPQVCATFAAAWSNLGTTSEKEAVERLYWALPCSNFSQEVLVGNPTSLAVLRVENVYWSDLGEPRRVFDTLSQSRTRPKWMAQKTAPNERTRYIRHTCAKVIPLPKRGIRG
jgi:mannose-1-phosphate guanylyltransferase